MISSCPPFYSRAASCLLRSHHALLFRLVASDCLSCSATRAWSLCPLFFSRSLFLHAALILSSSSSVLLFCSQNVCSSLPRGSFNLIMRSSVAAVTPGHPNQSLCPVCEGVQRRERVLSSWKDLTPALRTGNDNYRNSFKQMQRSLPG